MKVITCVVNNPIFIEIQYKSLKKYLKNDFEYIVFNDAKCDNIKKDIENLCKRLEIKCINIPNYTHLNRCIEYPSIINALEMNFMLKYQIANPDKYLILDSNIFLIDYLDITERYKDYKTAFNIRSKNIDNKLYRYIWKGIVYFDMNKIDDIYYLDWNGMSEEWLKRQIKDNEKIPSINELEHNKIDDYHISNIYFMKPYKKHTWKIDEIPNNLEKNKKLINFLINDKRNYGELIYGEIYDNIFYRDNCNIEDIEYHKYLSKKLNEIIIDVDDN